MGHHPVLYAAVPLPIPVLSGLPRTCSKISVGAPAPRSWTFNMYHGGLTKSTWPQAGAAPVLAYLVDGDPALTG